MSDIDYLIKTSKRFESLLSSRYDASGRGLAEKAKDVKHMLPDGVFKALGILLIVEIVFYMMKQ